MLKIVFVGTPEFGAIILDKLSESECKPVLVVTSPDKPVGRKQIVTPSPVKIVAKKHGIELIQPERISDIEKELKTLNPDLAIVAAYSQIIPKNILDIPKFGFINVHPSLLPKYRGPSPIQYAILNGDRETGVTIMLMDEKVDSGDIISASKIIIKNEKITVDELSRQAADLGAKLLIEAISKWPSKEIKAIPQDHEKSTYTKILKTEDGLIDWREPAETIERKIRAFSPWPGTYTFWQDKKIKILKARAYQSPDNKKYETGKVLVVPQNEIGVQTEKDFLVIEQLQMEGKKELKAEEFLRGYQNFVGSILK